MDVRILGPVEVHQNGGPIDLGPPRQRAVLARLLINPGETVTTDRLVDDLWPGDVPESAHNMLHVYLSKLRSALGDERGRLTRDGSGYRLDLEPNELDATRFTEQVIEGREALARGDAEGARSMLHKALATWRGPAFADIADESFVGPEAARLEEMRLVALELRVVADLELGRHDTVVAELGDLVDRHPLRERLWELLMLALYRCGRQAEALRMYQRARNHLVEELGIEPGPALQRLEDQILNQDAILDGTQAHTTDSALDTLPRPRTSFVGRERDLDLASRVLGDARLVTLTGPPGSGKTRMAIRIATDHGADYAHGAFFVPLAAVTDVSLVDTTVAKALGLRDAPGETPRDGLKAYLRDRNVLLVLDNFEQILGAAPFVGDLLDAASGLTVMVTSRSPLGLSGEHEFPVGPLAVPADVPPLNAEEIRRYDAVALFSARARASHPEFEVGDGNAAAIAEITARLDGLPLAIELAAARMKLLAPRDLLERMRAHRPVLADGPADADDRHRTLRDAIAWSYDVLTADEQALFRRLGVFRGFNLDAASAVTRFSEEDVLNGVNSLLSKSLIYRTDVNGTARFAMLETLREFALSQLDASGELEEVLAAHAGHYRTLAEESEVQLTRDSAHETIQMLTAEIDNIRSAVRQAIDAGDPDLGLNLVGSIWRFFQSSGRLVEGRQWHEALLSLPDASAAARAKGLTGLAGLAYWQGNYHEATALYEQALEHFRADADRAGEADTLYSMSMSATIGGELERGVHLADQARRMFEEIGSREKIGQVYMAQATLMHAGGRHSEARPYWETALGIARELGDRQLAVTELMGIGIVNFHEGKLVDALRVTIEALDEASDLENVQVAVWLLDYVGLFSATVLPEEAVQIDGAVHALRQESGGGMGHDAMGLEDTRVVASRVLDADRLGAAWAKGRMMTLAEAIDLARRIERHIHDESLPPETR
jgi:predicted ATPase/DNA-binding SARP family transcriptional activator